VEYRALGRTGWSISTIGFGAWAIGGDAWGPTDDEESLRTLHRAIDLGVNFIDTADVYGDGHSERLIARLLKERDEDIIVATKAGRRLAPHVASGYDRTHLTAFVERSLDNLEVEALDLLQLHCPPSEVYDMPEVFGILDDLTAAGKIRYYGVSVERVDEAVRALRYPDVQSVQIIVNMFRLKPVEELFPLARRRSVGILARVPLASGLLTGKLDRRTTFAPSDHRSFNRHGEAFDVGETFSGVDYEVGLEAVEELRSITPPGATMAQTALRWLLDFPVEANTGAADLSPLSDTARAHVSSVYDAHLRDLVHGRW
jgi:aryl-alcohol dehydrogenase-like predicted oxidoreductase